MVLVKNWPFFHLFLSNIGQENVFYDILERENAFLSLTKTTSSKCRKIEIFPKRLAHAFDQQLAIFPSFYFRQFRAEKRFLRYSRTKKSRSIP